MASDLKREQAPTVAIFPWGDVVEEFLDPIGLTLEDFVERMTGGWLFGYVAALQSAGWRAVIVCASEQVAAPRRLVHRETGAAVWAVPGRRAEYPYSSRRSLTQWLRTPWGGFARVLRAERCTALLAQEYEYARFDALALLAMAMRLPIFATFQAGDVTLSPLECRVRPWTLRRSRGLVVASAQERSRLAATYGRLRLRIGDIPNPIDGEEWRAGSKSEARAELGLPQDSFIAISHGRIDIRRKGLDVLIEAWLRFSAVWRNARLLLIGSGQDHEEFSRLLASRGASGVTWHSAYVTDRPLMRRWLSASDAYVITSRVEGMPVAPLEAMACGLPVVSTRAKGLPDIFADGERSGGILVRCDDAEGVACALERLAASAGLRETLGRAARARIEARFSLSAVGRALADFMQPSGVEASMRSGGGASS